jgi:hypothetical protein
MVVHIECRSFGKEPSAIRTVTDGCNDDDDGGLNYEIRKTNQYI